MSKAETVVPVRTNETTAAYRRRARQIIARIDEEVWAREQRSSCPDDLPIWLAAMAASLAPASWRQYKAALVAHTEAMLEADASWRPVLERLAGLYWSSAENLQAEPRPLRTSAQKLKAVNAGRLERLTACLLMHHSIAASFLMATACTGLRPVEWASARFEHVGDRVRVRVRNAKHTNNRAHGEFRTLWFDTLNYQHITAIRQTISAFREAASRNAVDGMQEQIERAFRAANDALWPRRQKSITPYTLRHQFAARIKVAYRSEEVAALMGHATDLTAFTHYARRSRSKSSDVGPPLPKPDPDEVQRVKLARSVGLEELARIKARQLSVVATHSDRVVEGTSDAGPNLWRS